MKVVSREVFLRHDRGRPVCAGFATYISRDSLRLMHCSGRADYSDGYDDYECRLSADNGRTWSEPSPFLKSYDAEGGRVRYAEPAALFDADTGKVLVIADKTFHPADRLAVDARHELVLSVYDPAAGAWSGPAPLAFDDAAGVYVSFSRPLKTSAGRLVFPAQAHYLGADGRPFHYRGCWAPAGVIRHILGDYRPDGSVHWHLSSPVVPDLEKTSRGFYEPAVAELSDVRFAMILRGDNSMFPDRPGYKWLSFSSDHCETWSEPAPLPCDSGPLPESGSSGSALFRSLTDGRLYWLGTLCLDGGRPNGNWPRSPLLIAAVQEEPFALRRETIAVIDGRRPGEPAEVQHSNFRFYQDRATGEAVLFLTRYGERGAVNWMEADYYRYRVALD